MAQNTEIENRQKILSKAKEIYDKDFQPLACGRQKSIEMIQLMENVFPDEKFGDTTTGFRNDKKIIEYVKQIMI